MNIQVWCETDVGLRRENNQDSFLIDENLKLYLVADGMGGHKGGEVASSMAVEVVREMVYKHSVNNRKVSPRQLLADAYREASHRIFDRSNLEGSDLHGMGTTLVSALMQAGVLYIANVGDSRAYLYKNRRLWQITEDHSLINEQLRAGLIAEKDVGGFVAKNVITRSVGFERDVVCDIIERQIEPEEMILICSDGLSGLVTDERIEEIITTSNPSEVVSKCINEAKKNGGDDNVTVMLIYAKSQ